MHRVGNTIRRSAAVLTVAVAVLVTAGTGAQAASSALPPILNGAANSKALRLQLTLPTVAQLRAALGAALGGVDTSALSALDGVSNLLPKDLTNIDETISLTNGLVQRALKSPTAVPDVAKGFATPLVGTLDNLLKGVIPSSGSSVSSQCTSGSCSADPSFASHTLTLPLGLGTIQLAGATSLTKSLVDTRNVTALADVHLSLASLLGKGGALAVVGDTLRQLTDVVNNQVLPTVNGVISQVEGQVNDLLHQVAPAVKEELDKFVSTGTIKPLPDISAADLLNLTILGAQANITPKAGPTGVMGLLAESGSKVANIDILKTAKGAWAHVGAVGLNTQAFANGVKGQATSVADSQVLGADLGGLLGLHIAGADLAELVNTDVLGKAIQDAANKAGLGAAGTNLLNAFDMLQSIAGIHVDLFNTAKFAAKDGSSAWAKAGTLAITVEPQLPVLTTALPTADQLAAGALIPAKNQVKYVKSGIALRIELPNSYSAVSTGNVLPVFHKLRRTGVGTPFAAAFILIGAALVVRRFALAK